MPGRNIEIKLRCPDLDPVRCRLRELDAATYVWTRRQVDTYFRVPTGRLKLRQEGDGPGGTLIAYHRAEEAASRNSDYQLLSVSDAAGAREMLAGTLGVLVVVDKRRELYLTGATRVHLDEVAGLGSFVELETVIEDQPVDVARDEHRQVLVRLGLSGYDVVSVSYSDLMFQ